MLPSIGLQRIRIARQSANLERVLRFYRNGLGLDLLDSFEDKNGYSGVKLGLPGWNAHLEITQHKSLKPSAPPDKDNFLVLYIEERETIGRLVVRLGSLGYYPVTQEHPLWEEVGVTFEDPDGWRVVLAEHDPY